MDLIHRTTEHFQESAKLMLTSAQLLVAPITSAVETLTECLLNNGKILACGIGVSGLDASLFARHLHDGFEMERPPLAAFALGDSTGNLQTATRQLCALGHPGDVFLLICSAPSSPDVALTIAAAHERDIRIIALTGEQDHAIASHLTDRDIQICTPSSRHARIHEAHRLVLHCLCDGIDCLLLGVEDQ